MNVMKIVIINALPKLQLLPFCFVGQNGCWPVISCISCAFDNTCFVDLCRCEGFYLEG